jgi:PEP-CTERM motif
LTQASCQFVKSGVWRHAFSIPPVCRLNQEFSMKSLVSARQVRVGVLAVSALTMVASAAAQGVLLRGFEGTSQLDNCALNQCFRPPDTMGAIGTTQFLETSNGSIAIYDKASGGLSSRVSMPSFWGAAGLTPGALGDQRVLFDHYTNRWLMIGFGATANIINVGVSATADAAGAWKAVAISVLPSGTADYPTLGLDDKGVYIGTNNFTPGFTGTSLLSIPKSSLYAATPTTTGITTFSTSLAGPDNGFAIQAAVNWQGNPGNTASVIADSRDANAQVFYKINGVNGPGATQTASAQIAGTGYTSAPLGRQPDGTRTVDTLSPRITANAVQVNGKIYSTATVAADVGTAAAVRWTVVDANTGVLLSSGKIQDANFDYYEGSIAVNEFGEAVIAYNRSGNQTTDLNGDGKADGSISFMARAFDVTGNTLTQDGSELLMRVSDVTDYHCSVVAPATTCRERWGDYAAVTIDPSDHHKFYAIGEYAAPSAIIPGFTTTPRSIWHTYIGEITQTAAVPEPSQYLMLLMGLGAVGFMARKRLSS